MMLLNVVGGEPNAMIKVAMMADRNYCCWQFRQLLIIDLTVLNFPPK
jgi:hypothetical protein